MSYFPCKNQSCGSYGKPHQNCRCYGGMAEGGEAKSFCGETRAHDDGCEYFADGGDTTPPLPEGFVLDKPATPPPPPGFVLDEPAQDMPGGVPPLPEGFVLDKAKDYSSATQKILTGVEGAGQGIVGPLMTVAEQGLSKLGIPDLSDEDIKARKEANPTIHMGTEGGAFAASMLLGTGEAALAAKAAAKAAEVVNLGRVGVGALKGAIQSGIFQLGDEANKWLLGEQNPEDAVGARMADSRDNILFGTALGAVTGGLGGAATNAAAKFADTKAGSWVHSFVSGIGGGALGKEINNDLIDKAAYKKGVDLWNSKAGNLMLSAGFGGKAIQDIAKGVEDGDIEGALLKAGKDIGLGLGFKYVSKPVAWALLKSVSDGEGNPRFLLNVADYVSKAATGAEKINKNVEGLFRLGARGVQEGFNKEDLAKKREKINHRLENGDFGQETQQSMFDQNAPTSAPGFAAGGAVEQPKQSATVVGGIPHNDGLAATYPEQNVLLQAARGRMTNYLNSLRPQKHGQKLAFDAEPNQKQQSRTYNRALDMAIEPLSILGKIHKGSLDTEDMTHFNNLHPELGGLLQKKITEQVVHSQLKGGKPPYKVRQSLSLFMGAPLASEMTPQSIMAAQASFATKKAQPQDTPQKGKLSALKTTDDSYMTANQAAAARQQKQS